MLRCRRTTLWMIGAAVVACLIAGGGYVLARLYPTVLGTRTIDDRLRQYGPAARGRLAPSFHAASLAYPPGEVRLVAFKRERRLDVFAAARQSGSLRYVRSYRILGASGVEGPKLREGDRQVPEGVYAVESLNPNSRFHLSLRLNYPNAFDREMGAKDGRTSLGGDIMIHGGDRSVGCLAMGDDVAEELFVLAADVGIENVSVVIVPFNLRAAIGTVQSAGPAWTPRLYESLRDELEKVPTISMPVEGGAR